MSLLQALDNYLEKLFTGKPAPKPIVAPKIAPAVLKPPVATVIRMPHEGLMSPEAQAANARREDRASEIILNGGIQPLAYHVALIASQSKSGTWYKTSLEPDRCTCPDDIGRGLGGCKHIRALRRFYAAAARLRHEEVQKVVAPTNNGKEAAMKQFLGSCIQVWLRRTSDAWRGNWMEKTELRSGSGSFSALGFTANDLFAYAGNQEYKITDSVQRREGSIFIQANQDEWMRRRKAAAAAVEETVVETKEEDVAKTRGQEVAEIVRKEAAVKEPQEAPEPQEADSESRPVFVCAAVGNHGVFVTIQGKGAEYHPFKDGKGMKDTLVYLLKSGMKVVEVPQFAVGNGDELVLLHNPAIPVRG